MTKRVYVSGTFDIPHYGHVELFRRAKKYGTVIVSVNTDEFTAAYKRAPIMTLNERIRMVASIKYVDEVIVNRGGADSKPAILDARADIIVHGDDWTGDSLMKQMSLTPEWLEEHHIKMVYVPYTATISTSDIIKRCQKSPLL